MNKVRKVFRDIILEYTEKNTPLFGTFNHVINENAYDLPEKMDNWIVLDIGANIGAFSVMAAKRGATVYAYEPLLDNFKALLNNIKINGLEDKIYPFNQAIGIPGKSKLFFSSERPDWCSLDRELNNLRADDYLMVDSISFQSIFDTNHLEHCNFLKLDCEGAEKYIFQEIMNGLQDRITTIAGEFHYGLGKNEIEIQKLAPYFVLEKVLSQYEFKLRHE